MTRQDPRRAAREAYAIWALTLINAALRRARSPRRSDCVLVA